MEYIFPLIFNMLLQSRPIKKFYQRYRTTYTATYFPSHIITFNLRVLSHIIKYSSFLMVNKLLKPRDKLLTPLNERTRWWPACVCVYAFSCNRMQNRTAAYQRRRYVWPTYPTGARHGVVGSGVHTLSFGHSCTSGTSDRSIPSYDKVRETRATRFAHLARCVLSTLLPYSACFIAIVGDPGRVRADH